MSSDLTFNKIAGGLLATTLAIVGLGELSNIVFKYETPAKPGYAIAVQEEAAGGGAEAQDVIPDWGTVLPAANVQAGATVAEKCKSCHNLDNGGPNLTGPNLYGVEGRKPGSHPGFAYSNAMTDFGGKNPAWSYDLLYQFLKGPQSFMSGTKMTFVGLKKPEDRVNLIAYLRTLSGSPPPIPAPNPKAAAAAAPAAGAPAAGAAPAGAAVTGGAPSTPGNTAPAGATAKSTTPPAPTAATQGSEAKGTAPAK
jgi:cytochrome c